MTATPPKNDTPDKALVEAAIDQLSGIASPSAGVLRVEQAEALTLLIETARAALSNSPVVGEDACTCQRHPTHCANDCPQHGLSEPTYTAGERVDVPPTPTDTADRREAVARVLRNFRFTARGTGDREHCIPLRHIPRLADAIASLIAVPDGMVLVPREPTEAMIKVGASAAFEAERRDDHWRLRAAAAWSAMITAAPPAKGAGE